MNRFTKDNPFEFEGVKVWPSDLVSGNIVVRSQESQWGYERDEVEAIHAFIEAERNEWAYTNDDRTEARKGRWVARESVRVVMGITHRNWTLTHDDFPTFPGIVSTHGKPTSKSKPHYHLRLSWWSQMQDFLTWHAAQNQPDEPTGLGAVVEVGSDRWTQGCAANHDVNVRTWWRHGVAPVSWEDLTDHGPVTVLSEGVAS